MNVFPTTTTTTTTPPLIRRRRRRDQGEERGLSTPTPRISPDEKKKNKKGVVQFVQNQWQHFKETMSQYWIGTKLLWVDIQTSSSIARRLLTGRTLTRRERKQLTRTTADLFRVVPFAVFIIVPFLEFLLPVALYLFPNMLPSTFQDSTKREETAKAMLRARLGLAGFLGETLTEISSAKNKKDDASEEEDDDVKKKSASADELSAFIEKARRGDIETEDVTRFARAFRDELTLDNLKRPQLVTLCRYMNMQPFGPDALLRFQLRNSIRELRADDQRIVYEGLDSLTRQEMQEACAERGMRAVGLTKLEYRTQLEQWLELAANRQVPIALLIMSRAFTLNAQLESGEVEKDKEQDAQQRALAEQISTLDADVVNEAVLEAAVESGSSETAAMKARKLDFLTAQNRLIAEERAAADAEELAAKAVKAEQQQQQPVVEDASSNFVPDKDAAPATERQWAKEMETSHGPIDATTEKTSAVAVEEVVPEETKMPDSLEIIKRKLEVAEMLEVMSHLSALEREKTDLEAIKAKLRADDEDVDKKRDGKLDALKRKITRMTTSLETEILKVDARLGDKLHIVDQDNDGVIDQDELRFAVKAILHGKDSSLTDAVLDDFVDDIMADIDLNADGILTVEEVETWYVLFLLHFDFIHRHHNLIARRDYAASTEE